MRLIGITVVALLTAILLTQLDLIESWWVRWPLIVLAGGGAGIIARWVEPKPQPAWVNGPDEALPVVFASYWPGETRATPEAIRAAMLTTLRQEHASTVVRRPDGVVTLVENHPKGWLIKCWAKDGAGEAVGCRADGKKLLDSPTGIDKFFAEIGEYFTFDEALAVMVCFADNSAVSDLVVWQLINEDG